MRSSITSSTTEESIDFDSINFGTKSFVIVPDEYFQNRNKVQSLSGHTSDIRPVEKPVQNFPPILPETRSHYHKNCVIPNEDYLQEETSRKRQAKQVSKEFFNKVSNRLKNLRPKRETYTMERPMFITTVRTGAFLEPPPEVAALLGLRRDNGYQSSNPQTFYSFSSKPRIVKSNMSKTPPKVLGKSENRREKRDIGGSKSPDGTITNGNTMYDRRVVRGSNYAALKSTLQADVPISRQEEARRRAAVRQRAQMRARRNRLGTPPPIDGRKHGFVQTEKRLVELIEKPPELSSVECQADLTPETMTPDLPTEKENTADAETQVSDSDFPNNMEYIVNETVNKILEQATSEVVEENSNNILKVENSNPQNNEYVVAVKKEEFKMILLQVLEDLQQNGEIENDTKDVDSLFESVFNKIKNVVTTYSFVSDIVKKHILASDNTDIEPAKNMDSEETAIENIEPVASEAQPNNDDDDVATDSGIHNEYEDDFETKDIEENDNIDVEEETNSVQNVENSKNFEVQDANEDEGNVSVTNDNIGAKKETNSVQDVENSNNIEVLGAKEDEDSVNATNDSTNSGESERIIHPVSNQEDYDSTENNKTNDAEITGLSNAVPQTEIDSNPEEQIKNEHEVTTESAHQTDNLENSISRPSTNSFGQSLPENQNINSIDKQSVTNQNASDNSGSTSRPATSNLHDNQISEPKTNEIVVNNHDSADSELRDINNIETDDTDRGTKTNNQNSAEESAVRSRPETSLNQKQEGAESAEVNTDVEIDANNQKNPKTDDSTNQPTSYSSDDVITNIVNDKEDDSTQNNTKEKSASENLDKMQADKEKEDELLRTEADLSNQNDHKENNSGSRPATYNLDEARINIETDNDDSNEDNISTDTDSRSPATTNVDQRQTNSQENEPTDSTNRKKIESDSVSRPAATELDQRTDSQENKQNTETETGNSEDRESVSRPSTTTLGQRNTEPLENKDYNTETETGNSEDRDSVIRPSTTTLRQRNTEPLENKDTSDVSKTSETDDENNMNQTASLSSIDNVEHGPLNERESESNTTEEGRMDFQTNDLSDSVQGQNAEEPKNDAENNPTVERPATVVLTRQKPAANDENNTDQQNTVESNDKTIVPNESNTSVSDNTDTNTSNEAETELKNNGENINQSVNTDSDNKLEMGSTAIKQQTIEEQTTNSSEHKGHEQSKVNNMNINKLNDSDAGNNIDNDFIDNEGFLDYEYNAVNDTAIDENENNIKQEIPNEEERIVSGGSENKTQNVNSDTDIISGIKNTQTEGDEKLGNTDTKYDSEGNDQHRKNGENKEIETIQNIEQNVKSETDKSNITVDNNEFNESDESNKINGISDEYTVVENPDKVSNSDVPTNHASVDDSDRNPEKPAEEALRTSNINEINNKENRENKSEIVKDGRALEQISSTLDSSNEDTTLVKDRSQSTNQSQLTENQNNDDVKEGSTVPEQISSTLGSSNEDTTMVNGRSESPNQSKLTENQNNDDILKPDSESTKFIQDTIDQDQNIDTHKKTNALVTPNISNGTELSDQKDEDELKNTDQNNNTQLNETEKIGNGMQLTEPENTAEETSTDGEDVVVGGTSIRQREHSRPNETNSNIISQNDDDINRDANNNHKNMASSVYETSNQQDTKFMEANNGLIDEVKNNSMGNGGATINN